MFFRPPAHPAGGPAGAAIRNPMSHIELRHEPPLTGVSYKGPKLSHEL